MTLKKDNPDFNLYTVAQVAELFTQDGKVTARIEKSVDELLLRHGTYREFAGAKLLTMDDVSRFLDCLAASGLPEAEPATDTPGYVVFMGSRTDATEAVLMDWCRVGEVERTVQRIENDYGLRDLHYTAATWATYGRWREQHKASWCHGKFYARTTAFDEWFAKLARKE